MTTETKNLSLRGQIRLFLSQAEEAEHTDTGRAVELLRAATSQLPVEYVHPWRVVKGTQGPDCPKCHGSDRIESVEATTIQYPIRIDEDGSFDYSGDESSTFDESASNIGKGDNFTLYCRDCGHEYTVTLQREEQ